MSQQIARRDFLKGIALGAGAFALGLSPSGRVLAETPKSARAVLIRDPEAVDGQGGINANVVSRMLDQGVCALHDLPDPKEAWGRVLKPSDVLGIKSNQWSKLPSPPELIGAIRKRAAEAGIAGERMAVGDHGILDDPIFQKATALINIRPLRIHHWAGIGGCLKNYIMFVREPSQWHGDSCADLGGIWNLPVCKGKTRLNVLVLLTPQFHGTGPHHFDSKYVWPYKGLLVGTDPVALDAIGVKLLQEKRKRFFERPPRGWTSTKHVPLADQRHGVGVADLTRIELIRKGWMEEALI